MPVFLNCTGWIINFRFLLHLELDLCEEFNKPGISF